MPHQMQDARKWKNHFRLTATLTEIELTILKLGLAMYTSYKAQGI
jgi:hypothetical protein